MVFDNDPHETALDDHIRTNREGAAGGHGPAVRLRLQLARAIACGLVVVSAAPALADDRAEVSTTLFTEKRDGGKGG